MPRRGGGRRGGGGRRKTKSGKQSSKQDASQANGGMTLSRAEEEQIQAKIKKDAELANERETYIGLDIGSSFIKVAVVAPIATRDSKNASNDANGSNNSNNQNDMKSNSGDNSNELQVPETIEQLQNILMNKDTFNTYFHKRINILADNMGKHTIPCVVTYLAHGSDSSSLDKREILIGSEAIKSSVRNNKDCLYHLKPLLSLHYECLATGPNKNANDANTANNTNNAINAASDEKSDANEATDEKQNVSKSVEFDVESIESQYRHWKQQCSQYGMQGAMVRPNFDFEEWSDLDLDEDDAGNDDIKNQRPSKQKIVRFTWRLKGQEKEYDASQALINILEKVYEEVCSQTQSKKIHCVLSVPSHYNALQLKYMESIVYRAGFNPIQSIYDYSSAIVAAGIDRDSNGDKREPYVLVVDFGTWQSSVTVCKLVNGMIYKVYESDLQREECRNVSGIAVDNCILKFCIKQFEQQNRGCYIEPENRKSRLKLMREVVRIKHTLSSGVNEVMFDIESFYEGIDYHFKLTRAKFEMIIYDFIKAVPNWIHNEVKSFNSQSGLNITQFDHVIAMGGMAQIPKLKKTLNDMFGAKFLNNDLMGRGIQSNFINVYGCAIQATTLSYMDLFEKKLKSLKQNNALRKEYDGIESAVKFERPACENEKFVSLNEFKNKWQKEEKSNAKAPRDEKFYYYDSVTSEIAGFANENETLSELFNVSMTSGDLRLECQVEGLTETRHVMCLIPKDTILPHSEKIDVVALNEQLGLKDVPEYDLDVYCCELDAEGKQVLQEAKQTLTVSVDGGKDEAENGKKQQSVFLFVSVDENEMNLNMGDNNISFSFGTGDGEEEADDEDKDENETKGDEMVDVD